MKLKVVCAWCKKTIRLEEIDGDPNATALSHGICKACKGLVLLELPNEKPLKSRKGGDCHVEYPN